MKKKTDLKISQEKQRKKCQMLAIYRTESRFGVYNC